MSYLTERTFCSRWILHDYLQVNGGAERLVSTIARGITGFSLGVSAVYPSFSESADLSGVALKVLSGFPLWLSRIPNALLTFGRNIPCIKTTDVVIYSGVYAPLAVKCQERGRRIYYCHTPPRFAFDRKSQYLNKLPVATRSLFSVAIDYYCQAYKNAVHEMDVVLTNSDYVRKRLVEQLGIDAHVVYPPVDINAFRWQSQGDYYLSLGRLEPNKRVDLVVKAFMKMPDKKLIVASGGSQFESLCKLARGAQNIIFVGWSRDEQLIGLIANAIACIYIPLEEDFGMSAIEAMAAGKPVIGVAEGGMVETILNGQTGILLSPNPDIEQLHVALLDMTPNKALSMRESCEEHAAAFAQEHFLEQINSVMF